MSELLFEPDTHTYSINGVLVPGVTSLLQPLQRAYRFVPEDVMERARQIGTAVHLACELDDKGTLDEEALDPIIKPYLDAWRSFCKASGAVWYEIEQKVYHVGHRYAGTLDRFGMVHGEPTYVDIKTTAVLSPATGVQLAGYKLAASNAASISDRARRKRMAVQLKSNGEFRCKVYSSPSDTPTFLSLLTLHNWQQANLKETYV